MSNQEICRLERKCKDLDDEKKDLEMEYTELDAKHTEISEKYKSLSVTLRQQVELEKESRTNWKDKYD